MRREDRKKERIIKYTLETKVVKEVRCKRTALVYSLHSSSSEGAESWSERSFVEKDKTLEVDERLAFRETV